MDKQWMKIKTRYLPEYEKEVDNFIEYARPSADSASRILCLCKMCVNKHFEYIDIVRVHLLDKGIDNTYTRWFHKGINNT